MIMNAEFSPKDDQERKSLSEVSEQEEEEIRAFLEATLSALCEHLVWQYEDTMRALDDSEGESDLRESIRLLREVRPHEIAPRIYVMAKEGNDALLLAILGLTEEKGSQYHAHRGEESAEDEYSAHIRSRLSQMFMNTMRASKRFGREYTKEDLAHWIDEEEKNLRNAFSFLKKQNEIISERGIDDYRLLDRILAGDYRKGDREQLKKFLDQELDQTASRIEVGIPFALRSVPRQDPEFARLVWEFIALYQMRKFVPDIIPLKDGNT